jgi:type VI protein secretion system component VasK
MTKYLWPLGTHVFLLVVAAWLIVAPWMWGLVRSGSAWDGAATTLFWTGIGLAVLALVGLYAWWQGLRQELVQRGLLAEPVREAPEEPRPAPVARTAPPDSELDAELRRLADAVLRDLSNRLRDTPNRREGT